MGWEIETHIYSGSLPFSGPIPVGIVGGRGERDHSLGPSFEGTHITPFFSSPFNYCVRSSTGLRFDTLMTLDWPSETVDVLFLCLEAIQIWTGRNHLWLNPIKIKGLWMFGLSDLEIFHLWLGGIAFLHLRVCNLAVFLGSRLLLEEQIVALARKAFAQLHLVHQFCPFLDWEALQIVTDALVTPRPNYCSMFYTVLPLKTTQNFQLVQNAAVQAVMVMPWYANVASALRGSRYWTIPLKPYVIQGLII